MAGMIGNRQLQPGEASLSHNGVLFLDELAEFRRDVLEALRAPLENREVRLVRSAGAVCFPSNFSLIAATNPCPCGFYGHPLKPCECPPSFRSRYHNRISGPLRDRMDLQIWIHPTKPEALVQGISGESSSKVRARVEGARKRQALRYKEEPFHSNAQLRGDRIRKHSRISLSSRRLLECLIREHGLSGRGWARLIKVARTIADLGEDEKVEEAHILEAVAFRGDHRMTTCV
jgi:magnesium chelatase family protein